LNNQNHLLIRQLMITVVIAITFLITGQCCGADNGNVIRYDYREAGFSIALPQHWREIPAELLEQQRAAMTEDISLLSDFQIKSDQTYPSITISLDRNRQISDDYLGKLPKVESGLVFSKIEKNIRKYDPATHTLWQLMSSNQQEYREFCSVTAMRFTDKGWILMVMVLTAEQYPEYSKEFQGIVNSIKVHKGLTNNSGSSTYELIKKIAVVISLLGILSGVFILMSLKFKGKKSNPDNDNKINSLHETDGEMMTRVYKGDPAVARKPLKILFFSFCAFMIIFISLIVFRTNIIPSNAMLFFVPMVIFLVLPMTGGYFLGKKVQEKIIADFTITLTNDSITINGLGYNNIIIYKNEISKVVEGRLGLKVKYGVHKSKTIIIRKHLKRYEELKRELQGWVK
jgi:hypothetical protein